MSDLAYKPNAGEVIDRLRRLHARQATDRILATFGIPSAALEEFGRKYAHGFCDYPDPGGRIAFWDQLLRERAVLEDDSIPCAYLSEMDQGLYGGLLGGKVQFMAHPESGWISSMVAPLLNDWTEFDGLEQGRLCFSITDTPVMLKKSLLGRPWFERYVRQLEVFVQGAAGKFGISHFILIDGLNFIFELLGATRTYLSLVDRPEMVRRAIQFAFDLNVAIHETFFERVGPLRGGTASNMVQWAPGRIVSESVDPFHMTSVRYFEDWGREPAERIFARFDGGVLHIHGNGRHLLEAVSTLRGLKAIFLGDDRGFPAAFDVLPQLRARTGDVPLVVQVDFERFADALKRHALSGGVLYKISGAPDAGAANRLMDEIRRYRV